MKYTISKEADKKIEEDIEVIKKIILKEIKPITIILFGGFGHGGGSFKKVGKKIIPLNDYDLYIITKKSLSEEMLEKVGKECSRALGKGGLEIVENYDKKWDENKFFHVDLHNITYERLRKLYPTQRTADLKTSIVVYGDKKILQEIPKVKISVSDAIRLLFNKLNHFAIADNNSKSIKSIYAVKGLTDLGSALLIFNNKYTSRYQDKLKEFAKLNVPDKLKQLVKEATNAKLNKGYEVKDLDNFYNESKKWVLWSLKKILKEHLKIKSEEWKDITRVMYKKLPYIYFNDYLGSRYLFFGQYYLNIKFFLAGIRKKEFLIKSLIRWKDAGLILGIAMILYSVGEYKEAERYLKKLTGNTKNLKDRILKLYSIYYLQKLI